SRFVLQTGELLIFPTDKPVTESPQLSTVYSNKLGDNTQIPFRQLNDVININGINYQIVIRKSQEQKLAFVTSIFTILAIVLIALLIATLVFNWMISKRLWQPFQTSLNKIRNIGLPQVSTIHFGKTNTKEFSELNASLNTMARKIHSDYVTMKEFTEDAAHEMQTPLAVAQTKLELLLQDTSLDASQTEAIVQATEALSRLSKLNQSLLLLAKIENQQYEAVNTINFVETTQKYLRLFDEIIKEKRLSIETNFRESFEVKIHPFLADSLISNLIANAIKYNYNNGKLKISVANGEYCINNTSELGALDPQKLFKRFGSTATTKNVSTGLGLAIVKRIGDTHGLSVAYRFSEEMHSFCLNKIS
ncbi:MAG TPA: HAMP domain-containing sensor histidine kinase, partial [Flavisolibacter sp.]|nr:HAMP domain-containing sensor histidine kinase [Flavisolibacter sp.]